MSDSDYSVSQRNTIPWLYYPWGPNEDKEGNEFREIDLNDDHFITYSETGGDD